jgi:hypothetical protein
VDRMSVWVQEAKIAQLPPCLKLLQRVDCLSQFTHFCY